MPSSRTGSAGSRHGGRCSKIATALRALTSARVVFCAISKNVRIGPTMNRPYPRKLTSSPTVSRPSCTCRVPSHTSATRNTPDSSTPTASTTACHTPDATPARRADCDCVA